MKHKYVHRIVAAVTFLVISTTIVSCQAQDVKKLSLTPPKGEKIAAFAEGCFWCSEHVFEAVVGVDSAVSGYAGGRTNDPTYAKVNTETTGHAESVLVYYDPSRISYAELLNVFFASHDPTTKDQQGPDVGNSYRSIIFYATPEEKQLALKAISSHQASFSGKIVSEVLPLKAFYRAEGYHQNYINLHPSDSYVRNVSIPRYERFKKTYKGKLKH